MNFVAVAESEVFFYQIFIMACDDFGVEKIFFIQQVFGFQKQVVNIRVLFFDISTADPTVTMFAGYGAPQGMNQLKYIIRQGFQ